MDEASKGELAEREEIEESTEYAGVELYLTRLNQEWWRCSGRVDGAIFNLEGVLYFALGNWLR
jgi:hypothetical protein